MQVGDEHDGGIDTAADEAVLDGIALEFVESHRNAGKGSPKTRQEWRQEVAGYGVADGNVDGTIDLGSPAMWAARRICNACLDRARSLQELLTVECEGDTVRVPVEQF